jgi:hypothetical protein
MLGDRKNKHNKKNVIKHLILYYLEDELKDYNKTETILFRKIQRRKRYHQLILLNI